MFVASFPSGPWQANCYLAAAAEGGECVVVDPGVAAAEPVRGLLARHGLTPAGVLLTHGHIDHVASAASLADGWDVPVWIHAADRELLTDPVAGFGTEAGAMLAAVLGPQPLAEPADLRLFEAGLDVAGLTFDVIAAPGHRPGCVLLRTVSASDARPVVFSGDVLFAGSIGRTDLPGGDHEAMLESLRGPVLALADDSAVLPGHGPRTTMAAERAANRYLQPAYLGSAAVR